MNKDFLFTSIACLVISSMFPQTAIAQQPSRLLAQSTCGGLVGNSELETELICTADITVRTPWSRVYYQRNLDAEVGTCFVISNNTRTFGSSGGDSGGRLIQQARCNNAWDIIVYGNENVLFYSRNLGELIVIRFGQNGFGEQTRKYDRTSRLRRTWASITPVDLGVLRFTDFSGETETYQVDNRGNLTRI
jgi:hypothetical protein